MFPNRSTIAAVASGVGGQLAGAEAPLDVSS
jgi:hypothetical protein